MNAVLHDRLHDFPPNELLARQARRNRTPAAIRGACRWR